MIARAGSGWQTVLADLSLILFMTTAAAVGDAPVEPAPASAPAPQSTSLPALAQPVAVWSAAPGGPGLAEWLRAASGDPRLRLTILASPAAAVQALELSGQAGRPARVVIDPNRSGPVQAMLGYDQTGLAQSLQGDGQPNASQEPAR